MGELTMLIYACKSAGLFNLVLFIYPSYGPWKFTEFDFDNWARTLTLSWYWLNIIILGPILEQTSDKILGLYTSADLLTWVTLRPSR